MNQVDSFHALREWQRTVGTHPTSPVRPADDDTRRRRGTRHVVAHVALALSTYASPPGWVVYPSAALLGNLTGVHRDNVSKILVELREAGFLAHSGRQFPGRAVRHVLTFPDDRRWSWNPGDASGAT